MILCIPGKGVEKSFFYFLRPIEDVREQDAIIVAIGLRAEHGDRETVGIAQQDLLDNTRTCHAVADHNQSFAVGSGHYLRLLLPRAGGRETAEGTPPPGQREEQRGNFLPLGISASNALRKIFSRNYAILLRP